MPRVPLLRFCLVVLGIPLLASTSLAAVPPTLAGSAPGDSGGGFERALAALKHAMAMGQTVEVFEGLPHPSEGPVVEAEKQKPSRQFDQEWFYAEPQAVSPELRLEVEGLLTGSTLAPYRGAKLCGAFHADFAVRWTWNKGESTSMLLVCFGCNEARVLSGGRWTADLTPEGTEKLRAFFGTFRKERPEPALAAKTT